MRNLTRAVALASAVLMLIGGAARVAHAQTDDWSAYRGSGARTGASPGPSLAGGEAYWQVDLAPAQIFYYATAVAGGTVYALGWGGDGVLSLATFDAEDGTPGWTSALGETAPVGLAVDGDRVVVASRDTFSGHGFYQGVDAATGAVAWTADTGLGVVSAPAIGGGRVYGTTTGAGVRTLLALDVASGAVAFTTGVAEDTTASAVAVAGGLVYVAGADNGLAGGVGYVRAYDATTGALAWEGTDAATGAYAGTPMVADGRVYAGSVAGVVDAFDAATGAQLWEVACAGGVTPTDMVYAGGTLYFFDASFQLRALDGATGAERWSTSWPAELQKSGAATILAAGSELYVLDQASIGGCGSSAISGELVALDAASGARLATSLVGVAITPSLAGGRIYATTLSATDGVNRVYLSALGRGAASATCEADLAAAEAASAACEADLASSAGALAACDGDLATCSGDLAICDGDLATCGGDLAACQATVASCTADGATLTAQLATCAADLAACQAGAGSGDDAALGARLDEVRDYLRREMGDATFELPGATPLAKLDALVHAIERSNHGEALHLHRNLGGRR